MKLVDVNVLLYSTSEGADHHEASRRWLNDALTGGEALAFCWLVLTAFLRLSTHRSIFPRPLSTDQAVEIVESWLARPHAVTLEPTPNHLSTMRAMLAITGTGGNLVNDAHLASLAREHGATIVTYDNDFARFPGVRWQRPA